MKATAKTHPQTIYARIHNDISLILRIENSRETRWVEADVSVPEKLSLAPDTVLLKGRMRVGIIENNEALEKSVRIYANEYTDAQLYVCKITIFTYDKDGVIDQRVELPLDLRCEEQKPSVL